MGTCQQQSCEQRVAAPPHPLVRPGRAAAGRAQVRGGLAAGLAGAGQRAGTLREEGHGQHAAARVPGP